MSENKIVNLFIFKHRLCKNKQPFFFRSFKVVTHSFVQPALFRPAVGNADGQIGVHTGKQPLKEAVCKYLFQKMIAGVVGIQSIAMGQEELLVVEADTHFVVMYLNPQFGGQVVEHPNVVVAREKVNRDARVDQLGNFAEAARKASRNNFPVLEPIVEDIAHQKQGGGVVFYFIQPLHKEPFAFSIVIERGGSEVNIGDEVYFISRCFQLFFLS